jgi:hypothetical protein
MRTYQHALGGMRTHGPSSWAVQGRMWLRQHRLYLHLFITLIALLPTVLPLASTLWTSYCALRQVPFQWSVSLQLMMDVMTVTCLVAPVVLRLNGDKSEVSGNAWLAAKIRVAWETCITSTLYTSNCTWTVLELISDFCGEKPASVCLIYLRRDL